MVNSGRKLFAAQQSAGLIAGEQIVEEFNRDH
jgi:hypothetical protein